MHNLYIVGTPIGNLEDMSLRAIRVLKEMSLIASEDTRTTRRLLSHFQIHTPLTSYFEHSGAGKTGYLLEKLQTGDVALVSEAGMPAISDPGYELVVAARENGINIIPVPGPSAAVTALAVSGLPTDRFHYLGFLPRKASERQRLLAETREEKATLIAYEAPHRIIQALHDIMIILGNRRVAVCRELTKLHEEVFRGTVQEAAAHFTEPRGEFTLVIAGYEPADGVPDIADLIDRIAGLKRAGKSAREAVAQLAEETGQSKKELYRLWVGQS
jgi:16S rRNA (cytidine1402-2'-O)-methyltransferase